jgi:uncharacterized protein (TIGR00369 family)
MSGTAIVPPLHDADEQAWLAWANGELTRILGMECITLDPDGATYRLDSSPWPLNPNGALHGGLILAAADHCLGAIASRALRDDRLPVTAALTSEFHAPTFAPAVFEVTVDKIGRGIGFAGVTIRGEDGRLSATIRGLMTLSSTSRAVVRPE